MSRRPPLLVLNNTITRCRRCPRLVEHCQRVANQKTARYKNETYWGKPVPNLLPSDSEGPGSARLLIVGLAPGAQGANRTGRMFTGDRSGDFLFNAMYRAGLCNQAESTGQDDGLELINTVITAAGHCAPPDNKPIAEELHNCSEYLDKTFRALTQLKVVLSLGGIAHRAVLGVYQRLGHIRKINQYPFGHDAWYRFDNAPQLACCYHPSQQNTFTGRLTPDMLHAVLLKARELAE